MGHQLKIRRPIPFSRVSNRAKGRPGRQSRPPMLPALGRQALLWALLLLVSGPLKAMPDYEQRKIAVGGKWLLTLRAPTNDMTIQQRADAVQARLVTILADPDLRPSDIVAVPLGENEAKVMVRNRLLVTATAESARLYEMTPMALARHWVRHLRVVLPQVSVKPNPRLRDYTEKMRPSRG